MKRVWEVCDLSDDIKFGSLDESKFAIEFYSVFDGKADNIYLNSDLFFNKTFLTNNMRFVIIQILNRLSGNGGYANLILSNEFGGGKTHTLLLVHHILTNKKSGFEYIRKYGIEKELDITDLPQTDVVSIDCRTLSNKITLWGKIAAELNMYDRIRRNDEERNPPGVDTLTEMLEGPVLLLVDELYSYLKDAKSIIVGDSNLSELTLNFVVSLMAAVSTTKRSQLLLSTTGEQHLYQQEDKDFSKKTDIMSKLRESTSRLGFYLPPVEKLEIYDIVRTRLIQQQSIKKNERDDTVTNFMEYYNRWFPAKDHSYREKMGKAYPFHPTLIDTLYDRVSTIQEFNKTRGILRFLGLVVKSVFVERPPDAYFVMTNHIPMDNFDVKSQLTDALGKENYKQVIETDVLDRARMLDAEKPQKFAERMAKTIFLFSLIGSAKKSGATLANVKLSICTPNDIPTYIDDIKEEFEQELWYIYNTSNDQYYFDTVSNIHKIIEDYKKEVNDQDVRTTILHVLDNLTTKPVNPGMEFFIWDSNVIKDDQYGLKFFIVDYKEPGDYADMPDIIQKRTSNNPDGNYRAYSNSLFFLYADRNFVYELVDLAKTCIACERAKDDHNIKFDEYKVRKIIKRMSDEKNNLETIIMRTYRFIAYPKGADLKVNDMGLLDDTEKLTDSIMQSLRSKDKILPKYSIPYLINDIIKFNDKRFVGVSDLLGQIKQRRSLALLMNDNALLDSIRDAVKEGFIGYSDELAEIDQAYNATIEKEVAVKWSGYIIEKNSIHTSIPPAPTSPILQQQSDAPASLETISIVGETDLDKLETLKKVEYISIEVSDNDTIIGDILTQLYILTRSLDIVSLKIDASFKKENMIIGVTGDIVTNDIKKIFEAIKNLANPYIDNLLNLRLQIKQKNGSDIKEIFEPLVAENSVKLEIKYNA